MSDAARGFDPSTITRPDERLMKYYVIVSLLTLVAFPITLIALWIQFRTMRYRFDDEGVWRAQGLLWRREVNVAYRRIQDIHLTSGLLQRWMGLATVSIQTAAGSATPRSRSKACSKRRRCATSSTRRCAASATTRMARPRRTPLRPLDAAQPRRDDALVLLTEIRDGLRRLETRLGGPGATA